MSEIALHHTQGTQGTNGTTASDATTAEAAGAPTRWLVPVGRALFAALFLMSTFGHFSQPMIDMAAAQGVPLASIAVPLSGIVELLGALSILVGYRARWGAALLVLFLVPVTLSMHKFWGVADPMQAQLHMVMFMKNLSLIGASLVFMHLGAGPFSLDARRKKAA